MKKININNPTKQKNLLLECNLQDHFMDKLTELRQQRDNYYKPRERRIVGNIFSGRSPESEGHSENLNYDDRQ